MSARIRAIAILCIGLAIAGAAAVQFRRPLVAEPLYPSAGLTRTEMLSRYLPNLKGTAFDTEIYVFEGAKPGGKLLLVGGTHPNEPAGLLSAVTILENLRVAAGTVYVIPRANAAAFTHNDSQEAMRQRYEVATPSGSRWFRNGSRYTNPARQWPDPTIYVNPRGTHWEENLKQFPPTLFPYNKENPGPGGQTLAGVDARNLNRTYPGKADGNATERVAHAIVTMIREENIDLAIDYHEASLEYPTINVIVAHQRASDISSMAELVLGDDGVQIVSDSSSLRLRGLSHREWGDAAPVFAILMETANPAQGRLKGRVTEEQITRGVDHTYWRAMLIQQQLNTRLASEAKRLEALGIVPKERQRKILQVEFPEAGIPLGVRVGRHVMATRRLVEAFNEQVPDRAIAIDGLPSYTDLETRGLGSFLHGPTGEPPAAAGS